MGRGKSGPEMIELTQKHSQTQLIALEQID